MGDEDAPTTWAPTELATVADETEAVTAWSLDDDEEWEPPRSRRATLITAGALACSLAALVATAVVLVNQHRGDVATPAPVIVTTTTLVVVGSPSSPRPTFTAEVPAAKTVVPPSSSPPQIPASTVAAYDRAFLNRLVAEGWTITNPAAMVHNAHLVCAALQRDVPPEEITANLMTNALMSRTEALLFTSGARLTYPDCI